MVWILQELVEVWEAEMEDNEEQTAYEKGFYSEGTRKQSKISN